MFLYRLLSFDQQKANHAKKTEIFAIQIRQYKYYISHTHQRRGASTTQQLKRHPMDVDFTQRWCSRST